MGRRTNFLGAFAHPRSAHDRTGVTIDFAVEGADGLILKRLAVDQYGRVLPSLL